MGELVMKRFFDKENFLFPSFEGKAKKQSVAIAVGLIVGFILASFTFFNMLYCFADIVGSIVSGSADVAIADFLRSLPVFLTFFMPFWTVLALQAFFRNLSPEKLHRSLMKNGIAITAFAGVTILYVIEGLIEGRYLKIVEGSPSALYPLDSVLYAVLFVLVGVFFILYAKKFIKKIPYVVPSRGPVCKKARGAYCTFVTFWCLFALFGLSGGIFTFFIYDFAHGYAFYGIMTALAYLLSPCFLLVWEFYFNELKEEKRKEALLPLATVALCVSGLVAALYFLSLGLGLDAPSNAGFGMFPVAFAASVNIATMLTVVTPLIVSVVVLVKGLRAKSRG